MDIKNLAKVNVEELNKEVSNLKNSLAEVVQEKERIGILQERYDIERNVIADRLSRVLYTSTAETVRFKKKHEKQGQRIKELNDDLEAARKVNAMVSSRNEEIEKHFEKVIAEYTLRLDEVTDSLEFGEMKRKKDEEHNSLRLKELEKNSEKKMKELRQQNDNRLQSIKMDCAQQIVGIKEISRIAEESIVFEKNSIIDEANDKIRAYESETQSFRKLCKLSFKLAKGRTGSLFAKTKGTFKSRK